MNIITKLLIIILIVFSGFAGFSFYRYTHKNSNTNVSYEQIQTIQTFHYPATFVKQLKGDPEAGKKIFQEYCTTCHGNPPKIDIHAPQIGDQKEWQNRKKLGMELLLKITINGVAAMPARGGCFECSDEQLRETIQYILQNSSS